MPATVPDKPEVRATSYIYCYYYNVKYTAMQLKG